MRGVRRCFVGGKYHLGNEKNSRETVTANIFKLKAKVPNALVEVEYLAMDTENCAFRKVKIYQMKPMMETKIPKIHTVGGG